jgi:exopolysaccharide biosynthesis protein
MVIDGRQNGYSEGVSEEELARLLLEQNCDDGINLDGGGSSSMWIRNAQSELSTANRPSDATGPRPVPVILNLRSPKSDPSK